MVRLFQAIVMAALTVLFVLSLDARLAGAWADYVSDCVNGDAEAQIRGCTKAIKSGRWKGSKLSWAYYNRGNAYADKGQYDRAIAEFDKAIKLNPKYALAYYIRGLVYSNKEKPVVAKLSSRGEWLPVSLPGFEKRVDRLEQRVARRLVQRPVGGERPETGPVR